ncbi:hypothetical protein NDU88_003355 [Pleurodeles waltl]|uniref:Uncharacterized protein n=1 Tax=Pleurodeles waltl TaxID=8319 RepID=A0AAV7NKF6_PLEWA|nr:hypothetical protein NDU88_003355 [Pleurodeles waltl]
MAASPARASKALGRRLFRSGPPEPHEAAAHQPLAGHQAVTAPSSLPGESGSPPYAHKKAVGKIRMFYEGLSLEYVNY